MKEGYKKGEKKIIGGRKSDKESETGGERGRWMGEGGCGMSDRRTKEKKCVINK